MGAVDRQNLFFMCFIIRYIEFTTNSLVYMESLDKLFLDFSSHLRGEGVAEGKRKKNPEYLNDTSVSLLVHSPFFPSYSA